MGAVGESLQVVLISSFRHGDGDFRRMEQRRRVVAAAVDRLIPSMVTEEAGQQLVVTGTEGDLNLEPEWLLLLLLVSMLLAVTGRRRPA